MSATIVKSAICRTNTFPRPNPTLFFFPGLRSKPIYDPKEFEHITNLLQSNHEKILKEYLNLQKSGYQSDYIMKADEHQLHSGKWEWQSYMLKGKKQTSFLASCPITAHVLDSIPNLMGATPFSYAFFSRLLPKTVIQPHYGPCNLRIRCHYPLIIPTSNRLEEDKDKEKEKERERKIVEEGERDREREREKDCSLYSSSSNPCH